MLQAPIRPPGPGGGGGEHQPGDRAPTGCSKPLSAPQGQAVAVGSISRAIEAPRMLQACIRSPKGQAPPRIEYRAPLYRIIRKGWQAPPGGDRARPCQRMTAPKSAPSPASL